MDKNLKYFSKFLKKKKNYIDSLPSKFSTKKSFSIIFVIFLRLSISIFKAKRSWKSFDRAPKSSIKLTDRIIWTTD